MYSFRYVRTVSECMVADCHPQIKPVEDHPYDYIYKWRLQQEHNMKAANGGKGMTDEQVEKYVWLLLACSDEY